MARHIVLAILLLAVFCGVALGEPPTLDLKYRWVYVQTNLLVDKNVREALAILERAAKADYNGVVLTDSKFTRWDTLPAKYQQNVNQVRQACRRLKLDCVAGVCPMGYSNDLLGRDVNLAEGLPVKDAPFVVQGGKLLPADDSCRLANGDFEKHKGDKVSGWDWADTPGKITFVDTEVKHHGGASLRMEAAGGNERIMQKLKVHPWRYYHVSLWVKTRDFAAASEARVQVLAKGTAVSLNYHMPPIARTQDWKRIDVTFNSLEFDEVGLYLGCWGARGGTIWWDDVRLEPGGLVNLVRREGAPLAIASEDGKTAYAEGKDVEPIKDPLMGNSPWPGAYDAWHAQPQVALAPGSSLKEGQRVLLSYYHTAIIYEDQVMCCMSEPKLYDIIDWQVAQVQKNLQPDGYFLGHDEIRVQGYDASCERAGKTPGEVLADNVKRCAGIVAKHDAGKPVFVWSDMFDPTHNAAKTGRYYLVKGDGPWYGSWKGLPKDVTVVNWHGFAQGRAQSLQHFADLGNRQILAGYYDADVARIDDWLADAAKVQGVVGVMYTTWRNDYDDLEKFAAEIAKFRKK